MNTQEPLEPAVDAMGDRCIEFDESGVLGEWVSGEQVHPLANVSMRRWRTRDGSMSGTYSGWFPPGAFEKGIMWWFPVTKACQESPPAGHTYSESEDRGWFDDLLEPIFGKMGTLAWWRRK